MSLFGTKKARDNFISLCKEYLTYRQTSLVTADNENFLSDEDSSHYLLINVSTGLPVPWTSNDTTKVYVTFDNDEKVMLTKVFSHKPNIESDSLNYYR